MAVDVCSSSPLISPRISFSHDLKETDFVPIESNHARSDAFLLNPTIDFHFRFDQTYLSSADEIFANGKILPVDMKKTAFNQKVHQKPLENSNDIAKKKRLIEFLSSNVDSSEEENKPMPKPFWQFRRSSSLNFTRSNSNSSTLNQKPKAIQKQNSLKEANTNSSVGSFEMYYPCNNNTSKRPYLRKSISGSYGNGVRVSPVLNIPPTYIAKGGHPC